MTRVVPTAEFASFVYGEAGVPLDDPAESFHEASRLYPHVAPGRLRTLLALSKNEALQQTTMRSSRTRAHLPGIDLPRNRVPRTRLRDLLARRVSAPSTRRRPLALRDLAALLESSYRATERVPGAVRRPVPSGGALYPLELYVLGLQLDALVPAAFHYDPFRHRLARLHELDRSAVAAAVVDPALVDRAAALLVVTATFWRARCKYGLRGYRFALLEAGHLMQNALLAAAALRLSAVPLGGFYDRQLDELVAADGLDEATVYAVAIGGNR